MMKPIPYGKHSITEEDIEAVVDVLKSNYLTQGPTIAEFEGDFSSYIGSKYAVAVANGTAALHLCAIAYGIKKGDKVITTPITFAATANCVRYAGGEVLFADIDPDTYLIDPNKVEDILKSDKNVMGIIPVDFAGRAIDMQQFRTLAEKYHCWLLEDACHAPGGYFIDSSNNTINCGSGVFADLAIFSFHPVKHIAGGEGGMVTTNNQELYEKLALLRTHGITKSPRLLHANDGNWYYEMHELGYNYRLTDIQAALAKSQLKKAELGIQKRREIAACYAKAFEDKSYIKGQSGTVRGHAYHLYIIEVDERKKLYDYLAENGIYTQVHYIPLHLQPYYKGRKFTSKYLPNAENYYNNCLSLPIFPSLTEDELEFIISKIKTFYE